MLLYISNHRLRSFIQMLIIQMAHIVNNHIIMAFYIDCIHTDICEQSVINADYQPYRCNHTDTATFPTKHANIYENCWKKKKDYLCKKPIASSEMTGASQRASRSVTGSARIQINNFLSIIYFFFFFLDGLILFGTLPATKSCCFFATKTLFLSVICSITDRTITLPEEMRRKQMNNDPNYNVIVFWTKSSWWNVVLWTLTSLTKQGFTAVDTFVSLSGWTWYVLHFF